MSPDNLLPENLVYIKIQTNPYITRKYTPRKETLKQTSCCICFPFSYEDNSVR